jgi:hypothetical protein
VAYAVISPTGIIELCKVVLKQFQRMIFFVVHGTRNRLHFVVLVIGSGAYFYWIYSLKYHEYNLKENGIHLYICKFYYFIIFCLLFIYLFILLVVPPL